MLMIIDWDHAVSKNLALTEVKPNTPGHGVIAEVNRTLLERYLRALGEWRDVQRALAELRSDANKVAKQEHGAW